MFALPEMRMSSSRLGDQCYNSLKLFFFEFICTVVSFLFFPVVISIFQFFSYYIFSFENPLWGVQTFLLLIYLFFDKDRWNSWNHFSCNIDEQMIKETGK